MANLNPTMARTALTPQIWTEEYFREYVRAHQFRRYMGTDAGAIIQVRTDLERKAGDRITFAAMRKLRAAGVTGYTRLEGNEELMDARALTVRVDVRRHAVAVTEWDEKKSVIDLLDAAKPLLMDWQMEKDRADIIRALGSIDGVAYDAASAGQRNTWLTNNADRVQFGSQVSNNTGTFSTSLTNIDGINDKLSYAAVTLAKRRAKMANPAIRPMRIRNGEEWFVMFANSLAFRDLKNDPDVRENYLHAQKRGEDNELFVGGDLIVDGVIVREIEELPYVANAGAGGTTQVGASFLCGAQALGKAWAQRPTFRTEKQDYDFVQGVGIQEIQGIEKLRFGTDATDEAAKPKDHGVYTVWTSAVPDA